MIKLRESIVILDRAHKEGLSVSATAERTGLDRKTIRKYIARGVEPPRSAGPRQPRPRVIAPYEAYVRERLAAFPELSIPRLLREIRPLGYAGGRTMLGDFVREVRPVVVPGVRGPLRDAGRSAGPGRLRPLPRGLRGRAVGVARGVAVLDGAGSQPLPVGTLRGRTRTADA